MKTLEGKKCETLQKNIYFSTNFISMCLECEFQSFHFSVSQPKNLYLKLKLDSNHLTVEKFLHLWYVSRMNSLIGFLWIVVLG